VPGLPAYPMQAITVDHVSESVRCECAMKQSREKLIMGVGGVNTGSGPTETRGSGGGPCDAEAPFLRGRAPGCSWSKGFGAQLAHGIH
jgi:hypothetical protein